MRRISIGALVVAAGLVVAGWATPSSVGAVVSPRDRVVRMWDKCDPATFNAAIGAGTCITSSGRNEFGRFGPGHVTFEQFVDALNPRTHLGHPTWRFSPERTTIRLGQDLVAVNVGGEEHTFTEVEEFGAGCVPFLNQALGLTGEPVADCSDLSSTLVDPGEALRVSDLDPGTHLFICLIHPWMVSEIDVRSR